MVKKMLKVLAILLMACSLLTGLAWAEMVIHLRNGQTVRLPYNRGDVARIEYTDQQTGGQHAGGTVSGAGAPWVVNSEGGIYRRTGGSWQRMPGLAKDIGCGADGSVWVIGTDGTGGGYGIYHWNGANWTRVDGGAVGISVR